MKIKDGDGNEVDLSAIVSGILQKHNGNSESAISTLISENYQLRQDKRKLREDLDQQKTKTPEEGSLVLSKDESKIFNDYKTLGSIEDITKKMDNLTQVQTELDTLKFEGVIRDAASAHNYKPTILTDLVKSRGLKVEMGSVEVEEEGKKINKSSAFVIDSSNNKVKLDEYIQKNLPDYSEVLTIDSSSSNQGKQWVGGQGGSAKGTNTNNSQKTAAQKLIESRYSSDEKQK